MMSEELLLLLLCVLLLLPVAVCGGACAARCRRAHLTYIYYCSHSRTHDDVVSRVYAVVVACQRCCPHQYVKQHSSSCFFVLCEHMHVLRVYSSYIIHG